MDRSSLFTIWTDFVIQFSALFSIINPLGIAFVFAEKTRTLSDPVRTALAWRVAIYSLGLIVGSMLIGSPLLRFLGIEMPALRIAGGIIVAVSGYAMLTEPHKREDTAVAPVTEATAQAMAFFPLTMPLTVGPGTIAVSIALGAQNRHLFADHVVVWLVALLVAGSIYVCYSHAAKVSKAIGPEGTRIVTRLTAFLLMCIGVQMMLTGIAAWAGPLLRPMSQ
jgi:multiple antibiotic resistance protein